LVSRTAGSFAGAGRLCVWGYSVVKDLVGTGDDGRFQDRGSVVFGWR
jgi:hypothetical protein